MQGANSLLAVFSRAPREFGLTADEVYYNEMKNFVKFIMSHVS